MAWRNHLWPAVMWWWTTPPIPRMPMGRDSSEGNCQHWENCSNPGSGGRRKPATSSRISPKVGCAKCAAVGVFDSVLTTAELFSPIKSLDSVTACTVGFVGNIKYESDRCSSQKSFKRKRLHGLFVILSGLFLSCWSGNEKRQN